MAKPLYRGTWTVTSRRLRTNAHNNPNTRCGICDKTLAEHPPTKTGKPQTWEVDHINPGDPTSPVRIAAASCNRSRGATHGNKQRTPEPRCEW